MPPPKSYTGTIVPSKLHGAETSRGCMADVARQWAHNGIEAPQGVLVVVAPTTLLSAFSQSREFGRHPSARVTCLAEC